VLTLAVLHFLRLVNTIAKWDYFITLPLSVPLIFFVLSGLIWGLAALFLGLGLWRGKNWSLRFTHYAAIAFTVYYWVDQLFLSIDPLRKTNFRFLVGANVFLLAIIYWILSRPKAQLFFGEANE
jgi:thiosulfate reductase cytochrome b subunit